MHDVREAIRNLRSSPVTSTAAILSLALGIGATTAIFSIFNSLLLKPLPVRNPDTLVALASNRPGEDAAMTYPVWSAVRDSRVLNQAFVWSTDQVPVADAADVRVLAAIWASGNFFKVLGVSAIAGRTFGESDDRRGGGAHGPVAVLSYRAARRLFGEPSASIGHALVIERTPFSVVGVLPRDFFGLNVGTDLDVVLPLETEPMLNRSPSRLKQWPWLHITARLTPGATVESATRAMRTAQPRIRELTMPDFSRAEDRASYLSDPWTMRSAATGSSRLRSRYQFALTTLLVVVALVLLVACANIAHLQLARVASRGYDYSVRIALGATRLRIVRLQAIESLLLAGIGASLGLACANSAGSLVVAQLTTWAATAFLDLSPDWRVLGVTTATAFGTRLIAGRDLSLGDGASSPKVAVINEAFARDHFPGSNPIGRTIMVGEEPTARQPVEIIGVVQNAAFTSVRDPIDPTFYMAFAQSLEPELLTAIPSISVSIRSAGEIAPTHLASGVAAAIARVDGAATVSFQTLSETLSTYYIRERLLAMLSGYFAALALLLAGVGVYGVAAHAASRRRTEIGVRIALGAPGAAIRRLMLGRIGLLCGLGLIAGGLLILWAGRLVRSLLFGVEPWDLNSILASAVVLIMVGLLAAWVPARRASRVEPAIVLRES